VTLPGDQPVTDAEEDRDPKAGFDAEAGFGADAASVPARPPSPTTTAMPGTRAVVGRGLDLNVAASAEIRRASVYIGLLTLLCVGPIAAVLWAFSVRQGGFEWLQRIASGSRATFVVDPGFQLVFVLVLLIGFVCLLSVVADAQLLATILIGARATGRPFDLKSALALARLRYWRLVRASFMIGLILVIPRFLINQVVMSGRPAGTEAQALIVTAIDILVSSPFAYVTAGIVLGAVGARESIRRSWRLARARWRLALLIGIVNTAVSYIAGFAVGAGGDILVRLGTVFGIGTAMGPPQVAVLAAIVALAIVSIGSLIMTIGALTAGPQVVAFLGLTGYSNGLDALSDPDQPRTTPPDRWLVSMPMVVALVINAEAAVLAVNSLR
jgi:hypothetical protein